MAQADPPPQLPLQSTPERSSSQESKRAPRAVSIRRQSLVIAFFVALTSIGAAYLAGWAVQWREVSRAQEARHTATSELSAKVKALELRLSRLEARRQLALALAALDERNFGIAAENLVSAGAILQKSSMGGETAKLAGEVQGFRLVATENLAEQRSKILAWSAGLDKALVGSK